MFDRPSSYDVVLYGASGFVGRQTVQYFDRHPASKQIRWAIAGRNRSKLEAVRAEVDAAIDVLVADSQVSRPLIRSCLKRGCCSQPLAPLLVTAMP